MDYKKVMADLKKNKVVNLSNTIVEDNNKIWYNINFDTNNDEFVLWTNDEYKWFSIDEIKTLINNRTLNIIGDMLGIFDKFLGKPNKTGYSK